MNNKLLLLIAATVAFASCKKTSGLVDPETSKTVVVNADSAIANASFNFSTTKSVSINVNLATNNNEPIKGVPVNIYPNSTVNTEPLATVLSDEQGQIHTTINLPAYMDTLIVDAKYIGLMRNAKVLINNSTVNATIGGPNGFSGGVVVSSQAVSTATNNASRLTVMSTQTTAVSGYSYMGTYDSNGVPTYLESPSDVITAELLSFINASLPETQDVRKLHPSYLQSTATADLNITADADVWITFVSEGAGYLNSIGYYTYTTGNAPKTPDDITKINYMFPNASLPGSGGDLKSGSKVKLGRFSAGTSIGFVLLANAWNGSTRKVDNSATKFYSTTACNPETTAELKKHTVLLYSEKQNLMLIGFDDQNRQTGGSDNDFNDVLFYATSNPVKAISATNVQPIDEPKDSDGDGVTDVFDQYPNDATRAYDNFYPSKTGFGTLAFEDLWPSTGDYDLNDLVVGYHYKLVTNAKNNVVEMYADYNVKAAGASFLNGFGVQLPFSPGAVKNVTGQKLTGGYIKQNGNGTEASQTKTVIIPFDNYQAVIKRPGGYYINTQTGAPYITGDTVHVYLSLNTPLSLSSFGTAPFNPFLISNQRRGYEVHLPDYQPTDLADTKLLGTLQDNSVPGQGHYYKSKNGWPWALNFSDSFDYPAEGAKVSNAYTYFLTWAKSGGTLHQDWYLNQPGNRNSNLIYSR